MIGLTRGLRWRFALSVLAGFGTLASSVALMATSAYLISRAALHPPVLDLAVAIVAVRAFGIGRGVLRYLERLVSHDLALRFLARLRVWLYRRLEPLVPGRLDGLHSGDLLSRLVADVEVLQNLLLRALAPPLVAAATLLLALAIVAPLLAPAGIALAATFLAAGVGLPWVASRAGRSDGARLAAARARLNVELVELVHGAAETAAFGGEAAALQRVQAIDADASRLARRQASLAAVTMAGGLLLGGLAVWLMLVMGVAAVRGGRLDGVVLAVLAMTAMAAFEAVSTLPAAFSRLGSDRAALSRLAEISRAGPSHPTSPARGEVPPVGDRDRLVELEGAWLRYASDRPWALAGVDLRLEPGKVVAVVGPSGSGKTSIANVLLRFRELDRGSARLGGVPLTALDQDQVRRVVGLAGQDAHLFNTSVLENVRLARPEAGRPQVERVMDRVGLGDWIARLPEGLETRVGELGTRVSGGQRQRIALARALLADFPVLIADEPTAHLDPELATQVVDDLLRLAAGRSLLLLTHRLAGLERADEVLVLEAGRVVERGSHTELLENGGAYAAMWALEGDWAVPV